MKTARNNGKNGVRYHGHLLRTQMESEWVQHRNVRRRRITGYIDDVPAMSFLVAEGVSHNLALERLREQVDQKKFIKFPN